MDAEQKTVLKKKGRLAMSVLSILSIKIISINSDNNNIMK